MRPTIHYEPTRDEIEALWGKGQTRIVVCAAHPGVELPGYLKAEGEPVPLNISCNYVNSCTEFDDEALETTLSFRGERERVRIPYAAIYVAFAKPDQPRGNGLRLVPNDEKAP